MSIQDVCFYVSLLLLALAPEATGASKEGSMSDRQEQWLKEINEDLKAKKRLPLQIYTEEGVMVDGQGNISAFMGPRQSAKEYDEKRQKAGFSELEMFATNGYFHGFDHDDLEKFRGQSYDRLSELAKDPEYATSWSTIIIVIASLGRDEEADFLIDYIKDFRSPSNPIAAKYAREKAVAALTYPAQSKNPKKALAFLDDVLNNDTMRAQLVKKTDDKYKQDIELASLHSQAVYALELAATPDAIEILERHKAKLESHPSTINEETQKRFRVDAASVSKSIEQAKASMLEKSVQR